MYADFEDSQRMATDEDGQPRVFQIRGHLVHGIPRVGDSNYDPACPTCNPGSTDDPGAPTAVVVTASSPPAIVGTEAEVPDPIPANDDYNIYNGPQQEYGPLAAVQQTGVRHIILYTFFVDIIALQYYYCYTYLPIRNRLSLWGADNIISVLIYRIWRAK